LARFEIPMHLKDLKPDLGRSTQPWQGWA